MYDWSDEISEQDNMEICRVTQSMFERGEYRTDDHPLYTTVGNPFEDRQDAIWAKMRRTFLLSCQHYIGKEFSVVTTQSRVTMMRQDPSIDDDEMWHDHINDTNLNSKNLAGIWFVNVPPELEATGQAGTEFAYNWPDTSNTVYHGPCNLSWLIFPSTLQHRPGKLHDSLYRFVMSADLEYTLL
jgi:hypothetical protein